MKKLAFPMLVLAALLAAATARADSDHDRARRAVQAGEVLPLRTILDQVARDFPGDVIEAELEQRHGIPAYEIKVITTDGRVIKAYYDARTGSQISAKEKQP
ncbi:MAG TPA: PepSY domain-containing protein [Magnetospirillum sp.]|nr:PepSY domain-containing protein [Magnetospirillum sp.]